MSLTLWDFVLPALLLLFLPLGFWRGLWREILTSVGILLAAVTTLLWTGVWVRLLSSTLRLDSPSLQLLAQLTGFIATAVLVGYGSGLLPLRLHNGSLWTRLLGSLVGLINGSILMSFMLQFIYYYLVATHAPQNPVASSVVAWNLANWAGWFYLIVALLVVALVAISALARIVASLSTLGKKRVPASGVPDGQDTEQPVQETGGYRTDNSQG
jgi:uncharacterized membrane protein required for colicin V production